MGDAPLVAGWFGPAVTGVALARARHGSANGRPAGDRATDPRSGTAAATKPPSPKCRFAKPCRKARPAD